MSKHRLFFIAKIKAKQSLMNKEKYKINHLANYLQILHRNDLCQIF
ncbi:hypothetical protein HMPREF0653_01999 [Prevotella disiens JCM 6334 = ATCC 29426]|uniref:Uncharacterized protein n=1 Tax=Prevotella disiens JCM 6334 = ATCC 29426 TaxID=1235811 RepID=A0ABN0NQM6_9BACT|nr:hypothetical protein HMPREF0653_01999 [Prevotella disiens JCM 6334 = ATCC 29426]